MTEELVDDAESSPLRELRDDTSGRESRRPCYEGREALDTDLSTADHRQRPQAARSALRDSAEALALRSIARPPAGAGNAERGSVSPRRALPASTTGAVTIPRQGHRAARIEGRSVRLSQRFEAAEHEGTATPTSAADAGAARRPRLDRLMTENGYFTKFFEDLPRGRFGAEAAAQAQGLAAPRYLLVESGVVVSCASSRAAFPESFR